MPRQFSSKRPALDPEDRRREVVAILARGLVRLRPARRITPESPAPEDPPKPSPTAQKPGYSPAKTPCSGAENTAQCDPRVNGKERVAR